MNFLVTGATGFIGRALVSDLIRAGHSVTYLGRRASAAVQSGAKHIHWAGASEEPQLPTNAKFNAVVNLAGEPITQRWNAAIKKRLWESRVDGTRALVGALSVLPERPEVLVSASAIGYYGNRGTELLTEGSSRGTGFLADLCAEWEAAAETARTSGIRVVTVRIGIVLAKEGGILKKSLPLFRMALGGKLASGRQWLSWIAREDLVRLLQFAIEQPVNGPMNGTSPQPVTNTEFTRALASVVRRPAVMTVPGSLLKLGMGEVATHVLDSTRVLPSVAQERGFQFTYTDIESCLRAALS
jgi:uncharacterized protein (TIGR01777 family)